MLNRTQVSKAMESVLRMKTVLWEPMTDGIYGEFDTLEQALERYYICADDYYENRNGVLWIALND